MPRVRGTSQQEWPPETWGEPVDGEVTPEAMIARANEVREELARIRATGTAARGEVRVTVAAGGRLTGIVIGAAAMRLTGPQLAAEIMIAASQAQRESAGEVASIAAHHYPGHEMWESP